MTFDTFDLVSHFDRPSAKNAFSKDKSPKVLLVLKASEDQDLLNNFLPKILQAVKIDMNSEALSIVHTDCVLNILDHIKDLGIQKVISFGVDPKDLNLNLNQRLYASILITEVTFLFADQLSIISTNQDRKKLLWNNLQSIFLT